MKTQRKKQKALVYLKHGQALKQKQVRQQNNRKQISHLYIQL